MAVRGVKEKIDKKRVHHSGCWHSVTNKLRLQGQAGVIDGEQPKMLIVPAMTLTEGKNWRGKGYVAAVLVGLPESNNPLAYCFDEEMEGDVFGDVGLAKKKVFDEFKNCSSPVLTKPKDEENSLMRIACKSLGETVLGLAQYVRSFEKMDLSMLRPKNQILLEERSENMEDNISVPEFKANSSRPVLFVRFDDNIVKEGSPEFHPAPDPLALFCKAANGFSLMVKQKLLANTTPPVLSEYDIELEELDCQAEQQYIAAIEAGRFDLAVPYLPR